MLFYCNEEWDVLCTSGGGTVDAVQERAEMNYPGVRTRWVDVNTSIEDALSFYDAQTGGARCSFCRKRPFEIAGGWIEGKHATICHECVEEFHRLVEADNDEAQ
jgi:hypothetical protein